MGDTLVVSKPSSSGARRGEGDGGGAGGHRPIRVCLVAPSLDVPGGQAIQAARLSRGLRQLGSIAVGFVPINPKLPGVLRLLQRVRYVRTVVTSLRYVWALLVSLAKYDIIHVFSASYFSFVLAPTPAVLLGKWYGKHVILNYRSGEAEDHLRRWRRTALPVMRLADAVIVPSGYLVGVFARAGLRARAVPNVVDFEQFRFRERPPLRPLFLSNRDFAPHYNVACVLRAFATIQRSYPHARLTVAGDGEQRGALMRLARELELHNVEFVGRVAPDRMARLYDAADVLLNAPNVDNMPGSLLEAFASGLPVVTTDAGGIPYIVRDGETGLMVRRGDHEAMAAAALRLLSDPALAGRLITRARDECRRKYAPEVVLAEWRKVYESLVGAVR
ncbi:MAG TPA: glycosyltransferase family 4 protein [Gemmatimonadales bacterium]|nr:glycosyltransferase family 4 protein [Gemmatimonadales bacterium]